MKFNWPQNFRGALSLTFDDGLESQLRNGIPLLEKFGFKGTFYVIPRSEEQLEPWREVADKAHEIGNHSLSHPDCKDLVKLLEKTEVRFWKTHA
jgi:peptidoglycan/xylan/chitin deacetylase (PgdA/CDA1 family)